MKEERKGEMEVRERNLGGLDPHNVWEGLTPVALSRTQFFYGTSPTLSSPSVPS